MSGRTRARNCITSSGTYCDWFQKIWDSMENSVYLLEVIVEQLQKAVKPSGGLWKQGL